MEIPEIELPWAPVWLYPIGDSQIGAQGSRPDKLRKHVQWALKNTPHPRFLYLGDGIDIMSPSNQHRFAAAALYDSVHDAVEDAALAYIRKFLQAVKGTEGKWLGAVHGHHRHFFRSNGTSDERIAAALGAPYLGTIGDLHLRFKRSKRSSIICRVWFQHGQGSGAMLSAPLNKLERFIGHIDANICIIGHYTRQVMAPSPYLYTSDESPPKQHSLSKWPICAGGWFEGYQVGSRSGERPEDTYVGKGQMTPVSIGAPLIKIRPIHEEHTDRLVIAPAYCDCGACN